MPQLLFRLCEMLLKPKVIEGEDSIMQVVKNDSTRWSFDTT